MNTRRSKWSPFIAALIVALGVQVVWAIMSMWGLSIVSDFSQPPLHYYETLNIAQNGTAVISSRSYYDPLDISFRTFDGKPLPNQKEDLFLAGVSLPADFETQPTIISPIEWSWRIATIAVDQRGGSVGWYLVRDSAPSGAAYLVGYDSKSNLPIGYFGRNGFRRTLPSEEEWFGIGRRVLTYASGAVAANGNLQFGGLAGTYYGTAYGQQSRLPPWLLFIIDGDQVLEVDLVKHTLRPVYKSEELRSMGILAELRPRAANATTDAAKNEADKTNDDDNEAATLQSRLSARLALRTAEKVIVLDPPSGDKREYILPEALRGKLFEVYSNGGPQLIVQMHSPQNWNEPRVVWLNADGTIERDETTTLSINYQVENVGAVAFGAPVPIAWLLGTFAVAPCFMMLDGTGSTYSEALRTIFTDMWPAFVAVILLGAILAAITYRLQRKYHRPATAGWFAFVLLLGWPGFVAYWLEHRQPYLEACRDCGRPVPRDRDACAACDTRFPTPSLVGTEIFA